MSYYQGPTPRTITWSWGLDDFEEQVFYHPRGDFLTATHVNSKAQQLTHNVLRTFSGKPTVPLIFANVDAATSGNWSNSYGATGYVIADSTNISTLSTNIIVAFSNQTTQVWTNLTADPRALLRPGSTNRVAAAWMTTTNQGASFTIDVNLSGTNQVALYCADWFGTGSILQRIEVFESADSTFSNPLDTRSLIIPSNGVYLVWKLSGHKILRITKPDATGGNKAMVSALFFDPSP